MDIKQVPYVVIETGGQKIKKSYEQIMERGGNSMFDCGIHKIQQEMETQFEDNVVKAVQKVGISIDKPQLERAILDAKSFYDDGYKDGKDKIKEIIYALWEDIEKAEVYCSNTEIDIDGKTLHSDIGYAQDGWNWFMKLLVERIEKE